MCSNHMTLFRFFVFCSWWQSSSLTALSQQYIILCSLLLMLSISLQIDNINLLTHCIFIWRRYMPQQRDIYTIIQAVTCYLCHCCTWDVENNALFYHLNNMCVCLEDRQEDFTGRGTNSNWSRKLCRHWRSNFTLTLRWNGGGVGEMCRGTLQSRS